MNALVVSIVFSLGMLLTAVGWFVTNLRTKKMSRMSYDPLIDKINEDPNPNTGHLFFIEELDERAKRNAVNYGDVL